MSTVVKRVVLRRVTPEIGYAEVHLPGVLLTSIRVGEAEDGQLWLSIPTRWDRLGRLHPIFVLDQETQEAIRRELIHLWVMPS